jgi:hypothetical protein
MYLTFSVRNIKDAVNGKTDGRYVPAYLKKFPIITLALPRKA